MKKFFTLVFALFTISALTTAQGVKQLWIADLSTNKLSSIDTGTLARTERITVYNPVDFKLLNGKIYGTQASDWFLYEFDPLTGQLEGKIPKQNSPEGPTYFGGKTHHLTRANNNLFITSDVDIRVTPGDIGPGYFDYEYSHIGKWDVSANTFSEFVTEAFTNIGAISGPIVAFNDKFYGLTARGGTGGGYGFIYEWTPGSTTVTPKINLPTTAMGATIYFNDIKKLTLLGNQFYFVSFDRLFKWDPQTNNLEVLHIFGENVFGDNSTGGVALYSLIEKNGKLYGVYHPQDGSSDVIFEWDPEGAGTYSEKKSVTDINLKDIYKFIDGGDRIFGVASESVSPLNLLFFEYLPATNQLIKKGEVSMLYGETYLIPAPISMFATNSCNNTFSPVTVNASNNNRWVPITDSKGDVLAEIKPNGNNLGTLNVEAYIHQGVIRKDGQGNAYLNRSITINPQNITIGTPVELRLYITKAEFEALKAEPGSGISTIDDLAIFKSTDACSGGLITSALPIPTTSEDYEFGYVLKASVTSFSTFYFSNRTFEALPLRFIDFTALQKGSDALLQWTTENEINTKDFDIERSIDGVKFVSIGNVPAKNTAGKHSYSFTDKNIDQLDAIILYYRLKQRDIDGKSDYSKIASIRLNGNAIFKVSPNPAASIINVSYKKKTTGTATLQVIDAGGKKVLEQKINSQALMHKINISALAKGVYMISVIDNGERLTTRFVKQ